MSVTAQPLTLADLDYDLPVELIAQQPVEPRDAARLLVYDRARGIMLDRIFSDLPDLLCPGDLLVRNDTRVLAARTHFRRQTGGRLELLFLAERETDIWEVLVRGRPRVGETLTIDCEDATWQVRCDERLGDGRWLVKSLAAEAVTKLLGRHGETPLPPYIHAGLADAERYQTTYACREGSAAAPTAGLHFTPGLDRRLVETGVEIVDLTLHVGLGTFKPLSAAALDAGRLHPERFEMATASWRRVASARRAGRRVVAVGTTAVRTLEHLARTAVAERAGVLGGETDLFISPGFEFRCVDALLTNFHLPRTSLLALVMAFAGPGQTRALYRHAVVGKYRFYSLGDVMLVL